MKEFKKNIIKGLVVLLLLVPMVAYAASGTVGNSAVTMNINETKDITVSLMSANDVQAVGGTVDITDTSCLKVNSINAATNVSLFNKKFALASMGAIPSNTPLVTINVTGLKACETTISYNNIKITSTSAVNSAATISAGTITVKAASTPSSEPSSEPSSQTPAPTGKSSNALLNAITVSKGSLDPSFSSNTTSYTVTVENDVTSIDIGATKADSKATVTGTGTKTLAVGANTFNITVTAEDGTTIKTYSVTVNRKDENGDVKGETEEKNGDTSLKSLDVSGYTLYPTFNSNTQSYTMNVGNNITGLKVTAIANNEKSTVSVTGNNNFQVGMNTIYVTVTAENGNTKTYTVNVKRAGDGTETATKSTNNYLTNILVANGDLSPEFKKDTQTYSITVAKDVTSLDLKAFAEDSKSTVEVLGNSDLQIGSNTVTVKVTAEDGSVRVYTLNVNKIDKEANNKLENIIIGGQTSLNPQFDKDTTYYDAEVSGGTKSINITGITDNPNAKIEYYINGELQESGNLKLQEGYNLVMIKVTDENGLTRHYYVNVHRASNSFSLFGLKIPKWLGYLLMIAGSILFLLFLFLLFKRKKDKEEEEENTTIIEKSSNDVVYPKIEFKPEFNFGSKNNDNDTVSEGAVLNQESSHASSKTEDNDDYENNKVDKVSDKDEVPYDPYDEIVTVDELIDAIDEKDPRKLRILYEQEMLNRKKEEIKKHKENDLKHAKRDVSNES